MQHSRVVRTVHRLLAESLARLGTSHLFGLVGDANLFMVDAFVLNGTGRYIACTHEANAVLAALGFAQATGRIGVATVTHGPALTNTMTALAEGVKGGIPMVLLCGDTAPGDLQHLQKIDQRPVAAAAGAGFVEMRGPEMALADLERAFRLAAHERRPIVFNMRIDLQWAEASGQTFQPVLPEVPIGPARGAALEDAVGMIASARRPLILAGRAAIESDAKAALLALATRIEAPLATTLKAQGLFTGEPFDLGIFGNLSHPVAVDAIMASDCIVAFGASLSKHTTDDGALTRGKRVIQVLPDAAETPRMTEPGLRLIGDMAGTARAMIDLLDMAEIAGSGATDADLRERLAAELVGRETLAPVARTAPGTVDFVPALKALNAALPKERAVVADLGRFVTTAWRHVPVTTPRDLVYTCHFGAIGCGLGEAIGAAAANPDRLTVLIAGDGGFLLSGLSELGTAFREGMNLLVLICNDGSYGAEHVQFTRRGMDPGLSITAPPDFAAIASAMGIRALRVDGPESLAEACRALSEPGMPSGPTLIDLRLDPTTIDM
ncbi:thiamine pyrophosphate-binding protein [Jiella pelagia]|uniref:Thiamine pyrophosphate-binding protein n=1 Tax=Jiella pelagia TaxID=2986949 RepID=A0ABY7BVC9_9HYPH|nr:thiamine pyrophosphate-binding protein [Jiella pelagia]WAP67361.1 thiamine pyrophosphate-binding protein [Jiella pelagia]